MVSKGKGAEKDKAKGKDAGAEKGGKAKAAQTINVRHILCAKHAKKEEALAKLNAGAKFDGGSVGWKTKESLLPEFSAVAFGLAVSSTNSPKWGECKTSEGYHIIMVEGTK
ncbi:Peptidyl-prolyl cis-trans isomerase pin4 [Teratosphaeriaceae sp. CCFEE 6253]|nr:Peptidyl-prolyl cis-trans isomerase pin4 [Teratosphaeriaceae sp. CCFEE 6253]